MDVTPTCDRLQRESASAVFGATVPVASICPHVEAWHAYICATTMEAWHAYVRTFIGPYNREYGILDA